MQSRTITALDESPAMTPPRPVRAPLAGLIPAFAVTLAVSIWQIPTSQAQTGFEPSAVEEIMVTARRREESIQDVPVAITAFDSDYIRTNSIVQFQDIALHVPSFGISAVTGTTNLPIITLRGQRPSEMQMATDPAVPMYFADVVMSPAQGSNLALYDLQDIQVLKGPQGTLFGRNSTGGAVLLTPQRPGREFGGYLDVDLGNYDAIKVEGAVDLPVGEALALRIAARSIDRDGYQDNVADNVLRGSHKFWDEDSTGVRLSADLRLGRFSNLAILSHDQNKMLARAPIPWVFNPQAQLGGLYNAVHNGGVGIGGTDIDDGIERQRNRDGHKIETDVRATESVKNTFLANTTEYELNDDLAIKNIFGYRKVKVAASYDWTGMTVPLLGSITSLSEPVTVNPPMATEDAEQFSNELQMLGTALDGRLDWIGGLYWYRMKGSERTPMQLIGANPDWPAGPAPIAALDAVWGAAQNGMPQSTPSGDVKNESRAIFGELTYAVNDKVALTVGARQTWDDRAVTAMNFSTNSVTYQPQCAMFGVDGVRLADDDCRRRVSKDFSNFTWRTVVDYTPRQDRMLYGSISTGHRSGGINMRGTDNFTLTPFDEEKVITYEVGYKADWHLGDAALLRTNLAAYYQDYDDIQRVQATVIDGQFGNALVNAAKATIKGVEADIMLAIRDDLSLSLAWAYVDIGYDKWDVQRLVGRDAITDEPIIELRDNTDSVFTWVPEQSVTGSIRYLLPVNPAAGRISFMASVYWQSEMYTYAEYPQWAGNPQGWTRFDEIWRSRKVDGYTTANLRVDWRAVFGSRIDLAAYVNNVSDRRTIVGGNNNADSLGMAVLVLGPPRTFGASLRWTF